MTRIEIIESAFTVWGRELYLNTSLSQVARELGVSKPALYRHFRNKQALMDAMSEHYFDSFAAFIKKDYEKALQSEDRGLFILIRAIAEYFACNGEAFIFSLVKTYNPRNCCKNVPEALQLRGVDFNEFCRNLTKKYKIDPIGMHIVFMTLTFFMAVFHKECKFSPNVPQESAMSEKIDIIIEVIERGLGYSSQEIQNLDYEGLESRVAGTVIHIKDDPLLKAVAEAVAHAGPWEASMEQVARRSGLSKSSLYGHFENKHDMLRQLFMTEFLRIIDFASQGMRHSDVPVERMYLAIFSIAEYLQTKPDFLVAMDWVRTRRLDFFKRGNQGWEDGVPPEFHKLFEGITIKPFRSREHFGGEKWVTHWILFLIINTLLMPDRSREEILNDQTRIVYQFLTLGIGGFAT